MSEDDEYEIPLQDQRVFGAGIKRKRVKFVPSSSSAGSLTPAAPKSSAQDIASRYLSLVLPSEQQQEIKTKTKTVDPTETCANATTPNLQVCEVCNLPLDSEPTTTTTTSTPPPRPHASSLAHQVSLPHSHPPSHVDRHRKGLAIMTAYGWDPDARTGLGAAQQGIQFPIKTKAKDDRLGVGVVVPSDRELLLLREERRRNREAARTVDAGRVRKMAVEEGRRRERLQREFYGRDDVERLLRGD